MLNNPIYSIYLIDIRPLKAKPFVSKPVLLSYNSNELIITFHSIKMKIFQSTISFFKFIGVTPQSCRFNTRNLMNILILVILVVLFCAYLFFEADNLKDYTESIYMSTAFIAGLLSLVFLIWKKEYIFKFINSWEEITEYSE